LGGKFSMTGCAGIGPPPPQQDHLLPIVPAQSYGDWGLLQFQWMEAYLKVFPNWFG